MGNFWRLSSATGLAPCERVKVKFLIKGEVGCEKREILFNISDPKIGTDPRSDCPSGVAV